MEISTKPLTIENFPFLTQREGLQEAKKIGDVMDTIDTRLHIILCSGLKHYQDHGDTSVLTAIIKAVSRYNIHTGTFDGRSIRGQDMRAWVTKHANVKWNKNANPNEDGVAQGGYVKNGNGPIQVNLITAISTPFYTAKEATSRDLVDMDVIIKNSVKKLRQAALDGKLKPGQEERVKSFLNVVKPFLPEDTKKAS